MEEFKVTENGSKELVKISDDKVEIDLKAIKSVAEDELKFNPDYSVADVLKDLTEENEALEAENKRLREALEWQPIETIPEDINVNLYIGDGNTINSHVFQYCSKEEMFNYMKKATHWMSLPNPPQSALQGE